MSFLTRFVPTTARVASLNSAPIVAVGATRCISSTARRDNGPVKETLKKVDSAVSGATVKGIEKGEQVADKVKGTVNKATGHAEAEAGKFKGDASEMAGNAKGKAEETMGEAKGKAKEAFGEAKGKAKDAANDLKS